MHACLSFPHPQRAYTELTYSSAKDTKYNLYIYIYKNCSSYHFSQCLEPTVPLEPKNSSVQHKNCRMLQFSRDFSGSVFGGSSRVLSLCNFVRFLYSLTLYCRSSAVHIVYFSFLFSNQRAPKKTLCYAHTATHTRSNKKHKLNLAQICTEPSEMPFTLCAKQKQQQQQQKNERAMLVTMT